MKKTELKKNLVENIEYFHNPKIGKKIVCPSEPQKAKTNKQKANGISVALSSDIFLLDF